MANRGQAPPPPHPQPPADSVANDDDDQTWLDFLRSAGGTVRSSATAPTHASSSSSQTLPRPPVSRNDSSSDRKRRLTSTEEGRNYPYLAPGTSRNTAIDLSTPPRLHPHQRGHTTGNITFTPFPPPPPSRTSSRRVSDIMPPPWQPDHEVHQCPVCEQEFGFLFRKHHCRKCGRVVCANCSPHRITIPREYIVQPPGSLEISPLVGGAEVVRVCKPCVPDPWSPPTPQQQPQDGAAPRPVPNAPRRASETSQSRYHRRPSVTVPSTNPQPQQHDNMRFPSFRDYFPTSHSSQPNAAHMGSSTSQPRYHPANPSARPPRPRGLTAPDTRAQQPPPIPGSSSSPQRPPRERRRQVAEEDECPVCGIELPPGETIREAHVQSCVSSRFSTPPSHPSAAPPPMNVPSNLGPIPPTNPHDPNLPSSLNSPTTNANPAAVARSRAMSYRSRGIFPYIATEKDCVDGEGREQECTICMEEFEAGEEMGRLECLCKFHRKCIREWWRVKGMGSCPVHVFNE
jgi:hypothetical protein